jgi:hypothetical protein
LIFKDFVLGQPLELLCHTIRYGTSVALPEPAVILPLACFNNIPRKKFPMCLDTDLGAMGVLPLDW